MSDNQPTNVSTQSKSFRQQRAETRALERFAAAIGVTLTQMKDLFGDEVQAVQMPDGGYEAVMNEAGMRRLVAIADTPKARRFLRCVETKVLPQFPSPALNH